MAMCCVWPCSVRDLPLRGSSFSPAPHAALGENLKKGEDKDDFKGNKNILENVILIPFFYGIFPNNPTFHPFEN
mgnify:CR=1 FL=1